MLKIVIASVSVWALALAVGCSNSSPADIDTQSPSGATNRGTVGPSTTPAVSPTLASEGRGSESSSQQSSVGIPSLVKPALAAEPTHTPTPLPDQSPGMQSDLIPGIPEIVEVTFSGEAGSGNSRFIVRFDEPIITFVPPGVDDQQPGSNAGLKLVVENPVRGTEYMRLRERASVDNPRSQIEFGPVAEEFATAISISLNSDAAIIDVDGNDAVLGFERPIFVNPDYVDSVVDLALLNCSAYLEKEGVSPLIVNNVKRLQSERLSDDDRREWRKLLSDLFGYSLETSYLLTAPCEDLWSEAPNDSNASKRNHDFRCGYSRDSSNDQHYVNTDLKDALELLRRPYSNLDATDRAVLRSLISRDNCVNYYPQLFFDRWIPIREEDRR